MADRPILFSAPMVRALLDGRKTQTRRILKPQPGPCTHKPYDNGTAEFRPSIDDDGLHCAECGNGLRIANTKSGVRGMPLRFRKGDRLWVRETFAEFHPAGVQEGRFTLPGRAGIPGPPGITYRVIYHVDGDPLRVWHCDGYPYRTTAGPRDDIAAKHPDVCSEFPGWSPSIHMPRWASRLTLTVTDVRVQRLQEILLHEIMAEGISGRDLTCGGPSMREMFEALWNSINGAGSWDANPWIVALTFTVERRNIDAGVGA